MTMDPTVVTTAPLKSFVYRASPVQLFIWRRSEHAVLVPPSITTCPETLVAGSGRLAGHQSKVRPFHTPGTCGGGEEYFGQRHPVRFLWRSLFGLPTVLRPRLHSGKVVGKSIRYQENWRGVSGAEGAGGVGVGGKMTGAPVILHMLCPGRRSPGHSPYGQERR
eukprot:gene23251-biopygen5814